MQERQLGGGADQDRAAIAGEGVEGLVIGEVGVVNLYARAGPVGEERAAAAGRIEEEMAVRNRDWAVAEEGAAAVGHVGLAVLDGDVLERQRAAVGDGAAIAAAGIAIVEHDVLER